MIRSVLLRIQFDLIPAAVLRASHDLLVVLALVDFHRAVEVRELLSQVLQVGGDETQLQSHRLAHLLVFRGPR